MTMIHQLTPAVSPRGRAGVPRRVDMLAWAVVAGCFALSVCGAATRPVVHDEALTWNRFVSAGWGAIFDPANFDTNNHVLHSVLCLGSTRLFGPSPLALRLPALLGALVFLLALRGLGRRLIGPRPALPAALALVAFNPVIFTHFSLARGYSLALAFFTLAAGQFLEILLRASPARPPWALKGRLLAASLAMGLSIAAQPYFVYANSALAGVFLPLAVFAGGGHRKQSERAAAVLAAVGCLPGAALVWWVYRTLRPAMRVVGFNYVGSRSLLGTLRDLLEETLAVKAPLRGILVSPPVRHPAEAVASGMVLALLGGLAAIWLWRVWALARRGARSRSDRALALIAGALAATLALHALALRIWGTNYPVARLAMPLVVLFVLGLGCAAGHPIARRRPWRGVAAALGLVFAGWQLWLDRPGGAFCYEADVPEMLRALERLAAGRAPLRVDADWVLAPCLRYEWQTRALAAIGELTENKNYRVYAADETPLPAGCDAYIGPDRARLEAAGLSVVYVSARSGACLAVPRAKQK